jgi:hypothetical protein
VGALGSKSVVDGVVRSLCFGAVDHYVLSTD